MNTKNVYVGMGGDLLHEGHINLLRRASEYGQVTVGLLTDQALASYKRVPIRSWESRKLVIESIGMVHRVVAQDTLDYSANLIEYKPDFLVHGDDWVTGIQSRVRKNAIELMSEWGGIVVDVPYTKGVSTTDIIADMRSRGISPNQRVPMLRNLLKANKLVRVMESHSGMTGLIIENMEVDGISYDAMWSSSLTDSTLRGKPDIELVNTTDRLNTIYDMMEVTTKPIIYDGDTGGRVEHFRYTVRTLERAGISAVIIEDKTGLKQNSLFGTERTQVLEDADVFCEKLREGKKSQIGNDFMIIARIEALIAGYGVEEALTRGIKYVTEGFADGVMIHSKDSSGEDIKSFCTAFREKSDAPIVVVPTTFNNFTAVELQSWGVNVVIHANHMLRSSYQAMESVAREILSADKSSVVDTKCLSVKRILNLIK